MHSNYSAIINESMNYEMDSKKYLQILQEWGLEREELLIRERNNIIDYKKKDQKFARIMNSNIFDHNGEYNINRYIKWVEVKSSN